MLTEIGKLNDTIHPIINDKTELRKLQDELNMLTKRNSELESLISRKENNSFPLGKDAMDGAISSGDNNKLREMEKNMKQLKQEKEELHKVRTGREKCI